MITRIKKAFVFLAISLTMNNAFAYDIVKKEVVVKKGDSLISILNKNLINKTDIQNLVYKTKNSNKLTNLQIGQKLKIFKDSNNSLTKLIYETDSINVFVASKTSSGFNVKKGLYKSQQVNQYVIGSVTYSFNKTLIEMGLNKAQRKEVSEMLSPQTNLNKIRKGTNIIVSYPEYYVSGKSVAVGEIMAAELSYNNIRIQSFSFDDYLGNKSYFDETGKPLKEGIDRTPLESYKRVSSKFHKQRNHPVLGYIRAHNGVDYAAKTGTPIYAAASGKIAMKDNKPRGYGKFIVINHEDGFSTLYAHMNDFGAGVYSGKKVNKGDIIGYVGSTGLSTGPHLHYEIRKNGVYYNPQTVDLPSGNKISKNDVSKFKTFKQKHNEGFKVTKMLKDKEGKTRVAIRINK